MRNPAKQRNIEGFDLGRCLGSGASAVVREAINPETGQRAAIKIYDRFEKLNPAKIKNILAEVDNMARLSHPNIVKLLSYKECAVYVYVLMEFGGNTSLLKFVEKQKNNRLTEDVARPIIRQIISALDYCHCNHNWVGVDCVCHSVHVFHRDIKLDNMLIDEVSGKIKLIDFGFSEYLPDGQKSKTYCGSPAYLAPEIIRHSKNLLPRFSDIWAAGVLIFRMIAGYFPFFSLDETELCEKILENHVAYPGYLSDGLKSFLQQIFVTNPNERLTFAQMLHHPWFNQK